MGKSGCEVGMESGVSIFSTLFISLFFIIELLLVYAIHLLGIELISEKFHKACEAGHLWQWLLTIAQFIVFFPNQK
jgi:hypothetical protein